MKCIDIVPDIFTYDLLDLNLLSSTHRAPHIRIFICLNYPGIQDSSSNDNPSHVQEYGLCRHKNAGAYPGVAIVTHGLNCAILNQIQIKCVHLHALVHP